MEFGCKLVMSHMTESEIGSVTATILCETVENCTFWYWRGDLGVLESLGK